MKKTKLTNKGIAIILALVVAFACTACGNEAETETEPETTAETQTTQTEASDELLETLFLGSDYQPENGWNPPSETLTALLQAAEDDGKEIDDVIICGDYSNDRVLHDYQISPDPAIDEIKSIVQEECPRVTPENMIFVQGNHDRMSDQITDSGLHEFDDYLVYVLNTEADYPWKQGKTAGALKKVKHTAAAMRECFDGLIEKGETRPVIIAGHVPLHFTGRTSSLHTTGDNLYSSIIFDAVNEAAKDLNITYFFGHNHSKGWDCYLGMSCVFKKAGDSILLPEFDDSDIISDRYTVETLNFTYLNAGYLGYCMNCSPYESDAGLLDHYKAADNTLTATICEIYSDRIVLTRYSEGGVYQMSSAGDANPYRDDSAMIPQEYYSEQVDSPQEIKRK